MYIADIQQYGVLCKNLFRTEIKDIRSSRNLLQAANFCDGWLTELLNELFNITDILTGNRDNGIGSAKLKPVAQSVSLA